MRPTATEPGLTKTENNMVCKRIQPLIAVKRERYISYKELMIMMMIIITTIIHIMIIVNQNLGGEKHTAHDNRCNHEWTFAFNYE